LHWKKHLYDMDNLRQSINLRGYAQKNPQNEYKREAFIMFKNMMELYKFDAAKLIIAQRSKVKAVFK